jgi:hypothetical protein
MKASRAPKIVIGVGLLAVYAVILSTAILRDGRPGAAAPDVPAATDAYSATNPQTLPPALPLPSDPVTAATPDPVSRTASAAASVPDRTSAIDASEPETASVPSQAPSPAPPVETAVASDTQITADVKSEVAAVAPDDSIDVTTRDGVVALTGSVSSEDVINKALVAARNVPAVKDVDVSALMVGN